MTVVDDLNDLLTRERGELEAVKMLLDDIAPPNCDIIAGGLDVLMTAKWSCSGLCHRINQLHGTATLDSTDLTDQLASRPELQDRLQFLCEHQADDERRIRDVLKRKDLDHPTRDFLHDLLRVHEDTARWCRDTLSEWQPDKPLETAKTKRPD